MSLSNHDQETARQYLLGQLTDDEQQRIEERLLTEDEFFEELEITKDELVEEYRAKQLTQAEREWFGQNFLASPEGRQRQRFASTLNLYISHQLQPQKKLSGAERFFAYWNSQPTLLRAAAAMAVLVILVGIYWVSRTPSPQSFATLTLTNSSSTRSSGTEAPKLRLQEHALKLTLMLPTPATPGERYRVELLNDKGENKTSEVAGQDAQSVTAEIPAAQLTPGQYAVTLSKVSGAGSLQRIPGSYYFTVE